jgi:tetratricopeptide (TPR) repeat protein
VKTTCRHINLASIVASLSTRALVLAVVLLCLVLSPSWALAQAQAAQDAAQKKPCGSAPSLQGTTWDGVTEMYAKQQKEVYEFLKGGVLAYTTSDGRFTSATWKQDGTCVYISINDGYVEFTGTVLNDRMEGVFKPRFGTGWTLKAERRSGSVNQGGQFLNQGGQFEDLRSEYKQQYSAGRFTEAARLAQRAAQAAEKEFGPTSTSLIETLNDLAWIYQVDQQYRPTLPVAQRVLAICEQAHGRQSKEYANALNTLGMSYAGLKKYVEAEDAYREGLATTEKLLGPNDPQMAKLLNSLGSLYSEQNRYAEAEPYLERSLKLIEKGKPDDNSLGPALNNLASAKNQLQKYDEALMLYERSLGIMERLGGENHPLVGRVLQNLAVLYERKGWKEEAQAARARAARILAGKQRNNEPVTRTEWR